MRKSIICFSILLPLFSGAQETSKFLRTFKGLPRKDSVSICNYWFKVPPDAGAYHNPNYPPGFGEVIFTTFRLEWESYIDDDIPKSRIARDEQLIGKIPISVKPISGFILNNKVNGYKIMRKPDVTEYEILLYGEVNDCKVMVRLWSEQEITSNKDMHPFVKQIIRLEE